MLSMLRFVQSAILFTLANKKLLIRLVALIALIKNSQTSSNVNFVIRSFENKKSYFEKSNFFYWTIGQDTNKYGQPF